MDPRQQAFECFFPCRLLECIQHHNQELVHVHESKPLEVREVAMVPKFRPDHQEALPASTWTPMPARQLPTVLSKGSGKGQRPTI